MNVFLLTKHAESMPKLRFSGMYRLGLALYTNCMFKEKDIEDQNLMVKAIEATVYDYTVAYTLKKHIMSPKVFESFYKDCIFKLAFNFDTHNNTGLYDAFCTKEITDLPSKTAIELAPNLFVKIKEKMREAMSQDGIQKKYTTIYTCSKCKHSACTTRQVQTRALDEGYTIFVDCVNCRHSWRIS